jgi:hypothetical protein
MNNWIELDFELSSKCNLKVEKNNQKSFVKLPKKFSQEGRKKIFINSVQIEIKKPRGWNKISNN